MPSLLTDVEPWILQIPVWQDVKPLWMQQLEEGAQLFAESEDTEMAGIFRALSGAVNWLRQTPEVDPYLEPLIALQVRLTKAMSGRSAPGLVPQGKVQPDGHYMMIQAIAICASDILFRSFGEKRGMQTRADEEAAQICQLHGLTGFRGTPVSSDMVRRWRSERKGFEPKLVQEFRKAMPIEITPDDARTTVNELARKAAAHPK